MGITILDNIANLIFISAYWVKDMAWLRALSIIGSLVVMPYYYFQGDKPLWVPMMWSCVFISIHATRLMQILYRRRPVKFNDEERAIYNLAFKSLSEYQFKTLLKVGKWKDLEAGQEIQSSSINADQLIAISAGKVEMKKGDKSLGFIGPGDLLGLASLMKKKSYLLNAKVSEPGRGLYWKTEDLKPLFESDENLASLVRKMAGSTLAENLFVVLQTI